MKVGISTGCLYPMLTEECIDVLAKLGFTSFEIFFNTFSELKDEYLDMLKYILEKYNARVKSIHPFTSSYESFLLFSDYERRFMDGIKIYEMYFRTARKIGAESPFLRRPCLVRNIFVGLTFYSITHRITVLYCYRKTSIIT